MKGKPSNYRNPAICRHTSSSEFTQLLLDLSGCFVILAVIQRFYLHGVFSEGQALDQECSNVEGI